MTTETTAATKPHTWTDGGDRVLILRRINANGTSYGGFNKWGEAGKECEVEAPDWNPEVVCGGGLHGWPWGMGLGEGHDYNIIDDRWLVLAARPEDVVGELEKCDKCKCRSAQKIYDGSFSGAWALINSGRHRLIEAMTKSGLPGTASGNYSTAASSGNSSKAASSGDSSKAASSGYSSKAASSGDSSTAASSGDSSKAASSGDYSTAEARGRDTCACVAGNNGAVRVGERGAFAIPYYTESDGWRFLCGKVGEDGIEADQWYVVRDGKLTKRDAT